MRLRPETPQPLPTFGGSQRLLSKQLGYIYMCRRVASMRLRSASAARERRARGSFEAQRPSGRPARAPAAYG